MRISPFILAIFLLASPAFGQSTPKSKGVLNSEISSSFPDNTTGAITPAIVRNVFNDFVASWQQYTAVNSQIGTTYAVVGSDYGQVIATNNANPIAVTAPQPTGSFITFNFYLTNVGAGTATVTATGGTIDGAANKSVPQNSTFWFVSDGTGTNYKTFSLTGASAGGSNTQVQYNSTGSFAGSANLTWVSPTLTIGVASSVAGKLEFGNATSGTVTLTPVTGALGSSILSLPAATDTLVGKATIDAFTNKTFDTAATGNFLLVNGVTVSNVTGSGPVSVLASAPTITSLNVVTAFTATGLVSNADLAHASTTVNGTVCTLGSVCTPTATASNLTVGSTTVSSGTTTRVLFDNAGTLGEYPITGSTNVVLSASPTFTGTPILSTPTATSVAVGGGTLGPDAFEVTGSSTFYGLATISNLNVTTALTATNLIGNNSLAKMNAATIKMNATASLANAADSTIQGLSNLAAPSSTLDFLPIYDHVSGTIKNATPGAIAGSVVAGVASLNTLTGALTLTNGNGIASILSSGTNISFSADIATAGQYLSGTANKLLDAASVYQGETTITYGTTTVFDFNSFYNAKVTLTGNITTMTCNNIKSGQAGTIRFIQDASGSHTTVWCSAFKWGGGSITSLSTTGGYIDALAYDCSSTNYCIANLIKNIQ